MELRFNYRFSSVVFIFYFSFLGFRFSFFDFQFSFSYLVFRFLFFDFVFCFLFFVFRFSFFFCIVVLRQASSARRPSFYSQNEAKQARRPGNSCFIFLYYIILYDNERYFWILSSSTCSVHFAHQIDLKKRDSDGFFVEKKNLFL